MKSFETVTEAIADLKERGYDLDFNLKDTVIECPSKNLQLSAKEFEITETYRFEGETDPGDEMVVYAIEGKNGELKGTLVNAFGPYANTASDEIIAKLKFHKV